MRGKQVKGMQEVGITFFLVKISFSQSIHGEEMICLLCIMSLPMALDKQGNIADCMSVYMYVTGT